jgi:aminodeoxyfutalosine deaminase
MSIESFIRAMPKVELYLQLEGAMQMDTLLMIAEQNEISEEMRHFSDWIELLETPDYQRLDEMTQIASEWLQQPDDLARIVYDTGVALSKQNVRYAEISVNPVLYMQAGHSFETIMEAINDGRDRAERGWGVRMSWILTIPRNEPRRGDELARWASNVTVRKGGVVALGLGGSEMSQPVGQFERAFRGAEKKGVPRVCQAGDANGAEGVLAVLNELNPDRVVDGWGSADAPDVIKLLVEGNISLNISLARALCMGWVSTYAQYPLRALYDEDIKLVIGTGMPGLYKTTLSDEYLALVEHCGFSLEEVEELALNAVQYSTLPDEEKAAMIADFKEQYAQLRAEHIESEEPTEG